MGTNEVSALSQIGLTADDAAALRHTLSVTDMPKFIAYTAQEAGARYASRVLGVSRSRLQLYRERAIQLQPRPEVCSRICTITPQVLGLADDTASQPSHVIWPEIEIDVPPDNHLFAETSHALRQGSRGTCVAMSCAKALSFSHSIGYRTSVELSPEFFYYVCKVPIDENDNPGTSLGTAEHAVVGFGTCLETTQPYDPNPPEVHHCIGEGAFEEAERFRAGLVGYMPQGESIVDRIRVALCGTKSLCPRPVVLGVPIHDIQLNPETQRDGWFFNPPPGAEILGYHAVVVEGYEDGRVIAANWWAGWGEENPFKRGYATMSYDFVRTHAIGALTFLLPSEVDRFNAVCVSDEHNQTRRHRPTITITQPKTPSAGVLPRAVFKRGEAYSRILRFSAYISHVFQVSLVRSLVVLISFLVSIAVIFCFSATWRGQPALREPSQRECHSEVDSRHGQPGADVSPPTEFPPTDSHASRCAVDRVLSPGRRTDTSKQLKAMECAELELVAVMRQLATICTAAQHTQDMILSADFARQSPCLGDASEAQ